MIKKLLKQLLFWIDNYLLKILIGFLIFFIPLWPKIPAIGIPHTWVYIRLEDFFIAFTFLWGLLLFFRKKTNLNTPLSVPVVSYWIAGGISLIFTLLFTAPHLANFFPHVAALHYLRRIEYLGIFFLAFWASSSIKDLKRYLYVYLITVSGIIFYGFGQKILGFPAFLTMNEEFAKGIPLYLAPNSRLTSTFAGHYDLAAFLVLIIALFTGIFFGTKNLFLKIIIFILNFLSLILLLFTASRISFGVYLLTISLTLWILKKKKYILPVLLGSILLMTLVSGASERFMKTIRVRQVVYDAATGQAIGTFEEPPEGSIKEEEKVYVPITTETKENLPVGSKFIDLPKAPEEATSVATIKKPVLTSLKMSTISAEIATISGKFLIKKALVYDISLTTRIQGEWPRAWSAFKRNPLLGSGYSSISLSNDNDYLRLLGETGILGTVTFLLIIFSLFSYLRKVRNLTSDIFTRNLSLGFAGGVAGLCFNAVFIDVFEASKVAYTLWILAGIILGVLSKQYQIQFNLSKEILNTLKKIFFFIKSNTAIFLLILLLNYILLKGSFSVYFIGDDFTWLKWAGESSLSDLFGYFTQSHGFFYRPLAKILFFILYNIFWLKPFAYHVISLIIHSACAFLIYKISLKMLKSKIISLISALLFTVLGIHAESLFWLSASYELFGPLFALLAICFNIKKQKALASIFIFFSFLSHESFLILPAILMLYDHLFKEKKEYKTYFLFLLYIIFYLELRLISKAHWFYGDYSINFVKLPFNFVGNLISYSLGIFAGPSFLDFMYQQRLFFKTKNTLFLLFSLLVFLFILGRLLKKQIFQKKTDSVLFFLTGSYFLSLLPFLGLGNTASRYAYFPSVWLVLFVLNILHSIIKKYSHFYIKAFSLFFIISIIIFNLKDLETSKKDWKKAGEITYHTLALLRSNYLDKTAGNTFYIIDLPIKYGRAWVFPVGFEDGLWHIFGKESPKVVKVSTIAEGVKLKEKKPEQSYVFKFENFEIKEFR